MTTTYFKQDVDEYKHARGVYFLVHVCSKWNRVWERIEIESIEKLTCFEDRNTYRSVQCHSLFQHSQDTWLIKSANVLIAKRAIDVMTQTILRQANWNGGWFWRFFRAKSCLPKTLWNRKLRLQLHPLYFPQNTLTLTESGGEFNDLHSIFRFRALRYCFRH